MGRHDLTLKAILKGHWSLATGLYASTPVLTPTGWVPMADLSAGDIVVTADHGLLPIVAITAETRAALWAVVFPKGALDNETAVILPPGQLVLVETIHARPFGGDAQALVPAAALEGWRSIAPFVPSSCETILQMRLSRSALVQAGPGLILGVEAIPKGEIDLIRRLLAAPARTVLNLDAARLLVARLIAEEAGQALRARDQAALRPENRA